MLRSQEDFGKRLGRKMTRLKILTRMSLKMVLRTPFNALVLSNALSNFNLSCSLRCFELHLIFVNAFKNFDY
jgi:hypothetical protein